MRFNFFSIIVLSLLVLSLFVVSGQQGCKKEEKAVFNTTALTMNFVADAPPTQLVSGESYPIYVDVKNEGGYDIAQGNAHFFLSGIGENLEGVTLHLQNVNILNKKTSVQEGGKERLTFASQATPPIRNLPAEFNFTIRVDSCYKYATLTQTSICVGKGNGICSISGEKIVTGSNSNAPLQITSLTENIQGNKLYVTFTIENKGSGQVYLPALDCVKLQEQNLDEKLKQNQVEISVKAEGFSCSLQSNQPPYGSVNALNGITSVRTVTCEKLLTETSSYTAPFEIALAYAYTETLPKSIVILPP